MRASLFATAILLLGFSGMAAAQSATDPSADAVVRPHAKSNEERNDYLSATTAQGGAALEQAADNFAAKYPDSELRIYLYSRTLRQYQLENQRQGVLTVARKILTIDPNRPVVLALVATALADGLENTEPDRIRKIEEIRQTANRAIQTAEKDFAGPPNATPEELTRYRSSLQAMAFSALGIMELKTGDDAGAERDLQTALAMNKIQPDAAVWYHLALAQDHRRKYSAALDSVEQALQLASANPDLQRLAEIEHDHLLGLAGRGRRDQQTTGAEPPQ